MGTVKFIVRQEVGKDKVGGKKKRWCMHFWSCLVCLICYREVQWKMYKCINSGNVTDWDVAIAS